MQRIHAYRFVGAARLAGKGGGSISCIAKIRIRFCVKDPDRCGEER
jgi:hypothetical protein